ncbi:MAG: metallophosphoesterase [Christensenellaceae bacterium]|jgi:predicted phosphohydrolase|nr:metallophosphoesterase [Christensenellaceae bacterium]
MKLFALGDLHLSQGCAKPMDIFGANWDGHADRIAGAWERLVGPEDVVLIPGDISWAMHMQQAAYDLELIARLPGRKVLLRGNHDYWWDSLAKVRAALPAGMYALQNDSLSFGGIAIAGTRGWVCPGSALFDAARDQKLYQRELMRLELSLKAMEQGQRRVCMLHYPPFNERRQQSGFTELLEAHGVERVIYGHLHGKSCKNAFEGERGGIVYTLCSADHLEFTPKLILEV